MTWCTSIQQIEYPIPFNPLHLDEGDDIDLAVDDLLTIFGRVSGDVTPRMREILNHTFYALLEKQGSTLLDVEILLDRQESGIRDEIIRTTDNPRTARFFQSTFPSLSRDACLPIITRIGQLISPKRVQTLLCQPGRSFNFREAMDDGKILLFNLSDGILGEQTSQLLGQLIVSKIQMATMSRADTPSRARVPFYLYLDEFQTFTGVNADSYEKLLSRARKYNLGLILAHQQTGQISQDILRDILGNAATILSFNVSYDDAKKLSHEYILEGEEQQTIQPEEFLRLQTGQAIGKIGKTVFHLQTALMDKSPDPIRAKEVIEASRRNYGV